MREPNRAQHPSASASAPPLFAALRLHFAHHPASLGGLQKTKIKGREQGSESESPMRHPGGTCRHARHTDETCRRALRRMKRDDTRMEARHHIARDRRSKHIKPKCGHKVFRVSGFPRPLLFGFCVLNLGFTASGDMYFSATRLERFGFRV